MNTKKELLINGKSIYIKPTPFEGKLSIEEYEQQLYSALLKIGVTQKHISISSRNSISATISWRINSKNFSFTCRVFETFKENFGACTQAIKEDIRHILRGIKDIDLVLKQYEELESKEVISNKGSSNNKAREEILVQTKQQILNFENVNNNENYNENNNPDGNTLNDNSNKNKIKIEKNNDNSSSNLNSRRGDEELFQILNENDARRIIEHIKLKYPQFSNYAYIPDYDRIKLEKAYYYLGRKPHWK
ncbi:MAG: hypothetical protein LAT82_01385 [Nanoarchaeota archaeon]|nr:hypothetical protein [Nanoarchaeota archaeon]